MYRIINEEMARLLAKVMILAVIRLRNILAQQDNIHSGCFTTSGHVYDLTFESLFLSQTLYKVAISGYHLSNRRRLVF